MTGLNPTHNPALTSWIESAEDPATDFPIQNLPICSFTTGESPDDANDAEVGFAIGDRVLSLPRCLDAGLFDGLIDGDENGQASFEIASADASVLGLFPPEALSALRARLVELLQSSAIKTKDGKKAKDALLKQADVRFLTPVVITNYTDFYASLDHATTVGTMFRPDNPILPNYKHIPIGYHGRASSIVPSGTTIRRPSGQQSPPDDNPAAGPSFGPCKLLDYELEVGAVIARENTLGEPISITDAESHILGLCLVNDWSARDIQKWEYQPLGPFLAKNFATTISPFIVTMEALAPFRCPGSRRGADDPPSLPYLTSQSNSEHGGFGLTLEVYMRTAAMVKAGAAPFRVSRADFSRMFWTFAQMVTHHASGGCNLQPGDLLASGTVSGPTPDSRGCLLEATWTGLDPATKKPLPRTPIQFPTGERRTFLQDGDEVTIRGFCQRDGMRRIGFGECSGTISG